MLTRLRRLCDLSVAEAREYAGIHSYDGVVQDLSPAGVRACLARLGEGSPERDPHDEAHLRGAEVAARTVFEHVEEHRRNPLLHIANLDLACYDRLYSEEDERAEGKRRHIARWPEAVDAAVESLDRVPAPVARGLLGAARGLADSLPNPDATSPRAVGPELLDSARAAHARFVAHLEKAVSAGPPDAALGVEMLGRLMGDPEAMPVDLGRLSRQAEGERDRVTEMLIEACGSLRAEAGARGPAGDAARSALVNDLLADHPDAEGIYPEARAQIQEATAFVLEKDLLADPGGECRVGPAPPSRRWAMAMMSWTAPFEADAPAWYYVNPPDPTWTEREQEEWLSVFSRTTLPAITVHEVTPGHYAHGRMLRRLDGEVRRTLFSSSFVEGWAHYGEELMVEEGFRSNDPRFAVGVCIEALVRVTRLAVAIGLHTSAMTLDEAVHRFEEDAFLAGSAARSEAERAAFDPTYGRYTWGKLEIRALRDEARAVWGKRYRLRRFHDALLALGAPPLGLMGDAIGTV